jgi:hypothetical protein
LIFIQGATNDLAHRLEHFAVECPYPRSRLYFETTLAVVRIALKQTKEARRALRALAARPQLDVAERTALQLMEVHTEAADGNLDVARQTLASLPNIVPYEQFRLRRIRREVEHRFGLGQTPAPTRPNELKASENKLIQFEMAFWVDCAARKAA